MRQILILGILTMLGLAAPGCAGAPPQDAPKPMAKAKSPYEIKGDQVEGCECMSVCPCVFSHDVSFNDCRGTMVWNIGEGHYGATNLAGIRFAVALLKSGKNVPATMGKWEGVIFVSSNATPDQKSAVIDILSANWGKAFAKVYVRSESIDFKKDGEKFEVHIGNVASLKTVPLPGAGGQAPVIQHPSFSLIPELHCATTGENTYNDGAGVSWDFKDRNSFFGPFDYRGE